MPSQAANYLNIKSLLDLTCQTVAQMIKGKTPEEIRKTFNIKVCVWGADGRRSQAQITGQRLAPGSVICCPHSLLLSGSRSCDAGTSTGTGCTTGQKAHTAHVGGVQTYA